MKLFVYLSIALLLSRSSTFAFVPTNGLAKHPHYTILSRGELSRTQPAQVNKFKSQPLQVSLAMISKSFQTPKVAAFAFAFLVLAAKMMRDPRAFFWPGAKIDRECDAMLPDGSLGCPFIGYDIFSGSKGKGYDEYIMLPASPSFLTSTFMILDYGPFAKLGQLSKKYGKIFKTYSYGYPLVSISGVDNIKSLLKNEFRDDNGIGTFMIGKQNIGEMFGENMLLYENNAEKHAMLRKLVGTAMTPSAIGSAIPSIRERANFQIDNMLKKNSAVRMEDTFQAFTLDIAWKQILGLNLEEGEVPKFHDAVRDWTGGMMNPLFLMPFKIPGLMKYTKAGRASVYLREKIDEKVSMIEKDGPDSSTLSKLFLATDEDGTRLTRKQVIDNALLLIFAGTETSASTLTCASLLLALHPDVWERVRDEQKAVQSKYGDDLNADVLERCTYLDAVIKETLRLQPVESGELRLVKSTAVVGGKQISKGWYALFNVKQTHFDDPSTYEEDGSHMDHFNGFKPDRWLDETTKPKEWMPFGDGRRRCIGERLGMTEMKVFLAMFARKCAKFELVNRSIRGME